MPDIRKTSLCLLRPPPLSRQSPVTEAADPPARRIRVQPLILFISMKHFLMISALVVLGCCFGSNLYGQTPCCKSNPEGKKACVASSPSGASAAVAPVPSGSKSCVGQSSGATSVQAKGVLASNVQHDNATAKVNCDPSKCDLSKCDLSKCDLSKCDLSKCDPSKCDLSKCMPGGNGASGKASKVQRL